MEKPHAAKGIHHTGAAAARAGNAGKPAGGGARLTAGIDPDGTRVRLGRLTIARS